MVKSNDNSIIMGIRRAEQEDIDSIVSVVNESNWDAYKDIIPTEVFEDPIVNREEMKDMFEYIEFYVYEDEDIVGVAGLNVVDKNFGKVRWVHILPERRGEGIGTALMKRLERSAKEQALERLVVYYVHEKAEWAHDFYRKLGYERKDSVPHRMGRCYLFEKKIDEED